VAVAGWQWCQSTQQIKAVILVVEWVVLDNYWLSCGLFNVGLFLRVCHARGIAHRDIKVCGGVGSGSGWVAVVSIDAADQGGHFGG
jgi:serine/threonine protein kinase